METLECIRTRRSVREFLDKPVEKEKLGIMLKAGKQAPSAGNQQTWKFILVENNVLRVQIANACMQQLWVGHAPAIIVVCAEIEKIKRFYEKRGEVLYSIQSCSAAIENMLLAAHDLGLGACWVGAFDELSLKRILGIPEDARPQAVIPVGYAARTPKEPAEYELETAVYTEKWGSKIKNVDIVMGHFAPTTQKVLKTGKDAFSKLKEKVSKIRKIA